MYSFRFEISRSDGFTIGVAAISGLHVPNRTWPASRAESADGEHRFYRKNT